MKNEQGRPHTIEKNYAANPALDFAWLRNKGIGLVQQFSGKVWTDFNLHDPGVTILEQLCFALTDLAYRTSVPVADLLTGKDGRIDHEVHSFFSREQILSSGPIAIIDFRKLVCDSVVEVDNIWFEPVLSSYTKSYIRGQYNVIIQLESAWQQQLVAGSDAFEKTERVVDEVKRVLSAVRNIGEEFDEFIVMQPQPVMVSAEILIHKKAVPEEILSHIYHRIEKALNPPIVFYTEQELLARGYEPEDIYMGPLLQHGIVLDEELKKIKTMADPAELIKAISGIEELIHIRRLEIAEEGGEYGARPVMLKKYHYPLLVFDLENAGIKLFYDNQPLPVLGALFGSLLQRLRAGMKREFVARLQDETAAATTTGSFRNTEAYTSLQHFFPAIYQIGKDGIAQNESPERKAKAKQLKAYLMLYEQIIANYLSQLSHLDDLFSNRIDPRQPLTYFFQPLYEVPGAADIIKAFTGSKGQSWEQFTADPRNGYIQTLGRIIETDDVFRKRKKRSLEHLLSRFNILPDKYPVILFELYYGEHLESGRIDEELKWKSLLLQNALVINNYRARGADYMRKGVEEPLTGFAYNMQLLLHIQQKGTYNATRQLAAIRPVEKKWTSQLVQYKVELDGETLDLEVDEAIEMDAGFEVGQIPVSFFDWGADTNNYKVLPHPVYPSGYLVMLKRAGASRWTATGRYSSRMKAITAQRSFIKELVELSIRSEGFHIIEHLLLAPSRESEVFGFRFYDEEGQPLLQQLQWTTWFEREAIIKRLLEAADNNSEPVEWINLLRESCTIFIGSSTPGQEPVRVYDTAALSREQQVFIAGKTRKALQQYLQRLASFFPRFRYEVLRRDQSVIAEEFYNAKITVVFPAWPRRFQDKGFREFAENLFMDHLPVHIRPLFLWVGIAKMRELEALQQTETAIPSPAELLTDFLLKECKDQLL
jgi:hypothetical protein